MGQLYTFIKNGKKVMSDLLKMISDSGNVVLSKFITYFGVGVGIGGGTVQAVSHHKVLPSPVNEIVQTCADVSPDWLAYMPAIAAVSLLIKNIADVYYKRLEHKAKSNETSND